MDEADNKAEANATRQPPGGLTAKQCQVLDLLIDNMTSKEMARALGISPHTVDQRLLLAREKLGAGNRRELAVIYSQLISADGRTTYGISDIDPDAAAGQGGDPGRGAKPPIGTDEARGAPHVQPAPIAGGNRVLLRIAWAGTLALVLILVLVGSLALYGYVARSFGL